MWSDEVRTSGEAECLPWGLLEVPFITVAIPMYNAAKYLRECLDSISAQTYRNFDVVILNDGSTDNSVEIARQWMEENKSLGIDVRLINQENHGLLLTRRALIDAAKGEYITFLDSDDQLRQDALGRIALTISRTNVDIVAFSYSRDPRFSTDDTKDGLKEGSYSDALYQRVYEEVSAGKFNNICGKAFRVSKIDSDRDYSGYGKLMQGEDWLQLVGAVDRASSLTRIRDTLYYYRKSDSQSMASYRTSQLDDLMQVTEVVLDKANKWGGRCPILAKEGVLRQVSLITNLMLRSTMNRRNKEAEYIRAANRLCSVINREDADRLLSKLRPDQALTIAALERRSFWLASLVANAVSIAKHVLRR